MLNKLNKYKNKKILVTGHTGFKGSWLVLWLKLIGAKGNLYFKSKKKKIPFLI